jgi:hypothetical protein
MDAVTFCELHFRSIILNWHLRKLLILLCFLDQLPKGRPERC